MRAIKILVPVVVSALALLFLLMPIDWCAVPHRRDLGALLCFLVFVVYLVLVDAGKPRGLARTNVLVGALCGLAIASIAASGPAGFALGTSLGAALGNFGLDWAA